MSDQTPSAGWPHAGPDEFTPYLAEQLKNPEVRAAYEAERAEQTPIPAEVREVADRIEHSYPVNDWAAHGFVEGLAAGRTASGCCQDAVDSDGHTHAETCVYLLGLRTGRVEGRTAAAADIRAYADDQERAAKERPSAGEVRRQVGAVVNAYRTAARVAENGADRPSVQRTAQVAIDCGGCGDTIWPTETVYEVGDGRVRCVICQVKAPSRAGADQ